MGLIARRPDYIRTTKTHISLYIRTDWSTSLESIKAEPAHSKASMLCRIYRRQGFSLLVKQAPRL